MPDSCFIPSFLLAAIGKVMESIKTPVESGYPMIVSISVDADSDLIHSLAVEMAK